MRADCLSRLYAVAAFWDWILLVGMALTSRYVNRAPMEGRDDRVLQRSNSGNCFGASREPNEATWNKAQLVRIPDGMHNNGTRQTAYYFNPQEAVCE